jgi:hypothetical protein
MKLFTAIPSYWILQAEEYSTVVFEGINDLEIVWWPCEDTN